MAERGPGYCPTKVDPEGINDAAGKYDDAEVRRISQVSAVVEAAVDVIASGRVSRRFVSLPSEWVSRK